MCLIFFSGKENIGIIFKRRTLGFSIISKFLLNHLLPILMQ